MPAFSRKESMVARSVRGQRRFGAWAASRVCRVRVLSFASVLHYASWRSRLDS